MTMDYNCEEFYQQDFTAEQTLLNSLRACLCDSQQNIVIPDGLKFSFDPIISNIYITLFQEGAGHIRWGSKRKTLADSLEQVLLKLRNHKRFKGFLVRDTEQCRIMLEIVTDEYPCDPKKLSTIQLDENRLEPGIHGLKFLYKGTLYYYMPTDAITHSLMTVKQIFNFLAKRTGVAKKTNSITARAKIMRSLITDCKLIKSFAFISYKGQAQPLYRGYPVPVQMNRENLKQCIIKSTDWILDYMKPNGQFLYYYDGIKDSEVDFHHPGMTNPTYYNILRHSGGTITLLRAYELTREQKYLEVAKKSIDFFLTVIKEHEYMGQYSCYPFFNRKSKLGGAGIGLVSLIHYFRLTRDDQYNKYIDGLVYHILSRVSETGELIGYFIHPSFYEGNEITDPDEETKKQLFSFYYPGEALLGLALYVLHIPDIKLDLRALILEKSKMALDFLIHERPEKYHYMFSPLPADGWLMQAIEEWVKIEGFAEQSYIDFVYNDTQAMIDHMYQEHNSPFFDYTGAFYYQYGEHAYPDGARCEGLIAAYYLALHLGEDKQADYFMDYILKASKNLLYTFNTPQSCYAHKHPQKSINSFRFKLTRQWMRIDSVQHTACFFARLFPVVTDQKITASLIKEHEDYNIIDGFKVIEKIKEGGFATVYLVEDSDDNTKEYALKKLHKSKYNFNRILREVNALKVINGYEDTIKCYRAKLHQSELCLLFDYARDGDLRNYVKTRGTLDQNSLFDLLKDILNEIAFANEHNILHLDISIFNIVLFKNNFSLIDWGLSGSGPAVKTAVIKGHRTYLAPEIYNGERTLASEIYSLGATLYYAATGQIIFDIHTIKTPIEQKMFKHFYLKPTFPDNFPEKTQYLLLRMLEKRPEKRATIDEIKTITKDSFVVPDYTYPVNEEDGKYDLLDPFLVYKKMAADGICHAQWQMGVYCENGKYVPQNLELARYWYHKAAVKGYSFALCSLALLYLEGKGLSQDHAKALTLLENASKQNHGKAQYYFAQMYEHGWATEKDIGKSTYWYTESAKNSYRKATTKLDTLKIDLFDNHSDSLEFSFPLLQKQKK